MKKINLSQSRSVILAILVLFFFSMMYGCKKTSDNPSVSNEVSIHNMSFSPSAITVPVNTTITWTNNDDVAHTVTSTSDLFDSGSIDYGRTFSHTFSVVGTYSYKCTYHSSMLGTVIVE